MWAELPRDGGRPRRSRRTFISEAGAATASVLLSLTVFSISGFYALRGSEVVVLPPERVLLYRAGDGDLALLAVAVPANMINAASQNYGDVLVRAYVDISPQRRRSSAQFPLDALVEPVFTLDPDAPPAACDYDVRCIQARGALFIERDLQMISLPGGGAQSEYLVFRAVSNVCETGTKCQGFANFGGALRTLAAEGRLNLRATLIFHSDGRKTISCDVDEELHGGSAAILKYLEERGWASLVCERRSAQD